MESKFRPKFLKQKIGEFVKSITEPYTKQTYPQSRRGCKSCGR